MDAPAADGAEEDDAGTCVPDAVAEAEDPGVEDGLVGEADELAPEADDDAAVAELDIEEPVGEDGELVTGPDGVGTVAEGDPDDEEPEVGMALEPDADAGEELG